MTPILRRLPAPLTRRPRTPPAPSSLLLLSPAVGEAGVGELAEREPRGVQGASRRPVRGLRGREGRVGAGQRSLTVCPSSLRCGRLAPAAVGSAALATSDAEALRNKRLVCSLPRPLGGLLLPGLALRLSSSVFPRSPWGPAVPPRNITRLRRIKRATLATRFCRS